MPKIILILFFFIMSLVVIIFSHANQPNYCEQCNAPLTVEDAVNGAAICKNCKKESAPKDISGNSGIEIDEIEIDMNCHMDSSSGSGSSTSDSDSDSDYSCMEPVSGTGINIQCSTSKQVIFNSKDGKPPHRKLRTSLWNRSGNKKEAKRLKEQYEMHTFGNNEPYTNQEISCAAIFPRLKKVEPPAATGSIPCAAYSDTRQPNEDFEQNKKRLENFLTSLNKEGTSSQPCPWCKELVTWLTIGYHLRKDHSDLAFGLSENASGMEVIELFCGIGGLSLGLEEAGIKVVAGIDWDETCRETYQTNHSAPFVKEDIYNITGKSLKEYYTHGCIRVIAAGVPCVTFSMLSKTKHCDEEKYGTLNEFKRVLKELRPHIFILENVPNIASIHSTGYQQFIREMRLEGYYLSQKILLASEYGTPQHRKRLILFGSRYGLIKHPNPFNDIDDAPTLRDAIAYLPKLNAGRQHEYDPMHIPANIKDHTLHAIRYTPVGYRSGHLQWPYNVRKHNDIENPEDPRNQNWRTWRYNLYGRMEYDEPSHTITTNAMHPGGGPYTHPDPEQHRGFSVREIMNIQGFPKNMMLSYQSFMETTTSKKFPIGKAAKHVGNAVPPPLGKAIGLALIDHLKQFKCPLPGRGPHFPVFMTKYKLNSESLNKRNLTGKLGRAKYLKPDNPKSGNVQRLYSRYSRFLQERKRTLQIKNVNNTARCGLPFFKITCNHDRSSQKQPGLDLANWDPSASAFLPFDMIKINQKVTTSVIKFGEDPKPGVLPQILSDRPQNQGKNKAITIVPHQSTFRAQSYNCNYRLYGLSDNNEMNSGNVTQQWPHNSTKVHPVLLPWSQNRLKRKSPASDSDMNKKMRVAGTAGIDYFPCPVEGCRSPGNAANQYHLSSAANWFDHIISVHGNGYIYKGRVFNKLMDVGQTILALESSSMCESLTREKTNQSLHPRDRENFIPFLSTPEGIGHSWLINHCKVNYFCPHAYCTANKISFKTAIKLYDHIIQYHGLLTATELNFSPLNSSDKHTGQPLHEQNLIKRPITRQPDPTSIIASQHFPRFLTPLKETALPQTKSAIARPNSHFQLSVHSCSHGTPEQGQFPDPLTFTPSIFPYPSFGMAQTGAPEPMRSRWPSYPQRQQQWPQQQWLQQPWPQQPWPQQHGLSNNGLSNHGLSNNGLSNHGLSNMASATMASATMASATMASATMANQQQWPQQQWQQQRLQPEQQFPYRSPFLSTSAAIPPVYQQTPELSIEQKFEKILPTGDIKKSKWSYRSTKVKRKSVQGNFPCPFEHCESYKTTTEQYRPNDASYWFDHMISKHGNGYFYKGIVYKKLIDVGEAILAQQNQLACLIGECRSQRQSFNSFENLGEHVRSHHYRSELDTLQPNGWWSSAKRILLYELNDMAAGKEYQTRYGNGYICHQHHEPFTLAQVPDSMGCHWLVDHIKLGYFCPLTACIENKISFKTPSELFIHMKNHESLKVIHCDFSALNVSESTKAKESSL